jgi:hypothetical protein
MISGAKAVPFGKAGAGWDGYLIQAQLSYWLSLASARYRALKRIYLI